MDSFYTITQPFRPALMLTRIVSRRALSVLRTLFLLTWILSGTAALITWYTLPELHPERFLGVALICCALWIEQVLLYGYHNYWYFMGLNDMVGEPNTDGAHCTYEFAEIIARNDRDITAAFAHSTLGREVLLRAGISHSAIDACVAQPRELIASSAVPDTTDEVQSLITLGTYLLKHDKALQQLLASHGIQDDTFLGALTWVVRAHHMRKRAQRWWGRDALSKSKTLGVEWSYGTAYQLMRFSRDINTSAVFSTLSNNSAYAREIIDTIETTLARTHTANVLLLGKAGVGKIDLLIEVSRRIKNGVALDAIANKHLVVLDTAKLFAHTGDKQSFEIAFLGLLAEAEKAGNIILVIENVSTFIAEAASLEVHVPELIDPFLTSTSLHIVVTDTPSAHHANLEQEKGFLQRFEKVVIEEADLASTTRVLELIALERERRYETFFTYSALQTITESAERRIPDGVMPQKAIALLIDVASQAQREHIAMIDADFVHRVVSAKTGMPSGPIDAAEREQLLSLEDILHERVVGQDHAIAAIARTMRRSRAGITSGDKPIGSFLFMGPTGVGKTETAKALAFVFFKAEDAMQRIDMSEFSSDDALGRLIGDADTAGTLSNMLREHPYTVLLLDELEKAHEEVHDLFLQILDEGIFTDGRGEQVNARNTIIIATSNAGSSYIIDALQQHIDQKKIEDEVTNYVIEHGIFKPELINRFDSTIVFAPLNKNEQTAVANLMLNSLHERIKARGYDVSLSDDLVAFLVEKGYSPEFGARPMNRVIQDVLEEKVAQKIISGEATKGSTISLSLSDFQKEELSA